MHAILGWFASVIVPWLVSAFVFLLIDVFISMGVSAIIFVGFDILVSDIFNIIDSMLKGLLSTSSRKMVESAGLFLALQIYFAAIGTRLAIFGYFKVSSLLDVAPKKRKFPIRGIGE